MRTCPRWRWKRRRTRARIGKKCWISVRSRRRRSSRATSRRRAGRGCILCLRNRRLKNRRRSDGTPGAAQHAARVAARGGAGVDRGSRAHRRRADVRHAGTLCGSGLHGDRRRCADSRPRRADAQARRVAVVLGMAGYDGLRQNIWRALADPEVHALALDIDSPGGMVAGCFDLADAIFEARGEKPIWAMVNEQACSAAYALASSADVVTVPRTGTTGSIGILYLHVDVSRAQRDAGLNVTLLNYGARKADGHPARPL